VSLEEIVRLLNTLGIEYSVMETGTDGAALVLPEYGRVLGLWPHWRGENAFWVNPEFFRCLQAGSKREDWLNPGGDRMWLSPRSEFFVEDPERPADSFRVPHALDPGTYRLIKEKSHLCMDNRGDLWAAASGVRIGFRIQRRLRVYGEAELADLWGTTYLRQAGYDEETLLEVSDCPLRVSLWNLLPVPPGGAARVPLEGDARQALEGDARQAAAGGLPPAARQMEGNCVLLDCAAEAGLDVQLPLSAVRTRAAYVFDQHDSGRSVLLLKEFPKLPPGSPPSPGEGPGPALGVWAGGPRSPFCELGFQSPAAGKPAGLRRLTWRTSLWAFSGRRDEILGLARRLTA
jgi:hypothetical protein